MNINTFTGAMSLSVSADLAHYYELRRHSASLLFESPSQHLFISMLEVVAFDMPQVKVSYSQSLRFVQAVQPSVTDESQILLACIEDGAFTTSTLTLAKGLQPNVNRICACVVERASLIRVAVEAHRLRQEQEELEKNRQCAALDDSLGEMPSKTGHKRSTSITSTSVSAGSCDADDEPQRDLEYFESSNYFPLDVASPPSGGTEAYPIPQALLARAATMVPSMQPPSAAAAEELKTDDTASAPLVVTSHRDAVLRDYVAFVKGQFEIDCEAMRKKLLQTHSDAEHVESDVPGRNQTPCYDLLNDDDPVPSATTVPNGNGEVSDVEQINREQISTSEEQPTFEARFVKSIATVVSAREQLWLTREGKAILFLISSNTPKIKKIHLKPVVSYDSPETYQYDTGVMVIHLLASISLQPLLRALSTNTVITELHFEHLTAVNDAFIDALSETEMEKGELSSIEVLLFCDCVALTDSSAASILSWLRFIREESTLNLKGHLRHVVVRGRRCPWSSTIFHAIQAECCDAALTHVVRQYPTLLPT